MLSGFAHEVQMVIGGEKQCYPPEVVGRACKWPYVRMRPLYNVCGGGVYRDYDQMLIFWAKPGFRHECILAKPPPKHPKIHLGPATWLLHPPTSIFSCTTYPYAYTQRFWKCLGLFWVSNNILCFYRFAGTRMADFLPKSAKIHLGISVKDAVLHKTERWVSSSVFLRSHTYNLVLVRAVWNFCFLLWR